MVRYRKWISAALAFILIWMSAMPFALAEESEPFAQHEEAPEGINDAPDSIGVETASPDNKVETVPQPPENPEGDAPESDGAETTPPDGDGADDAQSAEGMEEGEADPESDAEEADSPDDETEIVCESVDEPVEVSEVDLELGDQDIVSTSEEVSEAVEAAMSGPSEDLDALMFEEHVVYPDDYLPDDEAISGYIQQQFYGSTEASPSQSMEAKYIAGNMLAPGSPERKLYDKLCPLIKAVANGDSSSTEFTVAIKDIYENNAYTAADLGLSTLYYGDTQDLDAWAVFAFWDRVNVNFKKVFDALLIDLPYDLYWFDKTHGALYNYVPYVLDGDRIRIRDYNTGAMTYKFCVASAYSANGTVDTFVTNAQKCASINNAVSLARSIV